MATATAEFFEELAQRGYEPTLQSVTGTVRFDIIGAGNWWVTVKEGALTVASGGSSADCVYTTTAEDFVSMVRGALNPFTAALQGKVQLTGNTALALVMQRIFR